MSVVLLRELDDLAVQRVLHPPLDADHHGLVSLVRHHGAAEDALGHLYILSLRLRRGGAGAFILKRLDAGDGAAHLAHPRRLLELVGRRLEAQVELLALQLDELLLQLVVGLDLEIVDHGHLYLSSSTSDSPRRATTFVRIGNFSAARSNAVLASEPGIPSSSNRIRPGLTLATQNSGLPLREPMRT